MVLYEQECFENPQPTSSSGGVNILGLTTYIDCATCIGVNPDPNFCLQGTNTVAIINTSQGNVYRFNGVEGNPYGTSTGTYVLSNVPSAHPIAILNNGKTNLISYTGDIDAGTGVAPDGNTYNFYYGNVTITVT